MNKYCQGPKCHTYQTQDRKRGPKGAKYFQTRTISTYSYGNQNFCTLICHNDWWAKHGTQAIEHFGRLREPIRLTNENAWIKDFNGYWGDETTTTYRFENKLTNERIPLTKAQYDDNDYTIERARNI